MNVWRVLLPHQFMKMRTSRKVSFYSSLVELRSHLRPQDGEISGTNFLFVTSVALCFALSQVKYGRSVALEFSIVLCIITG